MELKESKTNWHFYISLFKSGIRILGCAFLMFGNVFVGGFLFFIAECFGVIEEL